MADVTDPRLRDKRDEYFAEQWAKAEEQRKKREEARRRYWLAWQKENARRAPYSAWLVLPCHLSDMGARPLPPGTPHWASPFIWVESPDPSGKALAGAENHLVAQIFNLGAGTSAPTRVQFFWCDPSVGLGAADAQPVGVETVEVPPMSSRIVRCATPWVPMYLNEGHECVFVSCDNHVLDPLLHPFQPWADRHVGQRNLSVLPAVAQAFRLWVPAGRPGAFGELRVMALRGTAAKGFAPAGNATRTLGVAAAHVLHGLRGAAPALRRDVARQPPPVWGERIDAAMIVAGQRVLDAARTACPSSLDTGCRPALADAQGLGDVLLRIEAAPGVARQVELQLRAVELARNQIIVLNITYVSGGAADGGYVLALAHPGWFDLSPPHGTPGDGTMNDDKTPSGCGADDRELHALVIQHNAQARMTFQLARQLAAHLPIGSFDKLGVILKDVTVDNHRLPLELFAPHASEALFPIKSADDLVRKLSAAVRMGLAQGQRGGAALVAPPPVLTLLEDAQGVELGRRAPIPAGHFTGPSIYGVTHAKGG